MSELTLNKLQAEYLRRMQSERLHFYEPYPAQAKFHHSQAEVRAFIAGNQSGKTFAGTVENIWTVAKVHPFRHNYTGQVYVRDCCVSFGAIKSILVPVYKNLIPKNPGVLNGMTYCGLRGSSWDKAYSEEDKTIYFADGSFIEFKTYEQGREAHQGTQRHRVRFDEEPPRDIYEENLARQIT
ncbi:MAG: terminase family protein, partial [Rectinemataceae bacterium]|nr:terminase family protein [Rectinemataceae bacterium]